MSKLPPQPVPATPTRDPGALPSEVSSSPPLHTTTAPIPTLDSAPPSGNFDFAPSSNSRSSVAASSLPPLPPPPSVVKSRGSSAMNANSARLPCPPTRAPVQEHGVQSSNVDISEASCSKTNIRDSAPSLPKDAPPTKNNVDPNEQPPPLPIETFASPHFELLARRQTHIPILVIATESSNRLAWKNGLRLTDLFQGLVEHQQSDFAAEQPLPPFRSVQKSLNLEKVFVQFVEPGHLTPYSYAEAHKLLQNNALIRDGDFPAGGDLNQELSLLEDRVDELLQDDLGFTIAGGDIAGSSRFASSPASISKLEKVKNDAFRLTSPLDIKWLMRYRRALDESTIAMPHDLIQCPPLVLLVCTTQEISTPVECLQELANALHYLPEPFHNGLYDPKAMRQEVLVLHDNVTGPKDWDETALRLSLQRHFGANASLVRTNSVFPGTAIALEAQETDDLWGGNGGRGNCLSVSDRVMLRRYFQTLVTGCLLPAVERRISELNAIVSERKKGVRNLVKSFWRKPKDSGPATTAPGGDFNGSSASSISRACLATMVVKYRSDSIESQTRLLADTLFLMQDYEAALGIYRLIRDDYKSDKAMVYYANVQEMMALCMIHMDPYGRAKDIFSQFETSLYSYTRAAEEERLQWAKSQNDPSLGTARPDAAPHATRLGTRLCLLIAASPTITSGRELEVADLLASASSHETSLGAAVLLEQASSFYHCAAMYRKYAFHMLMSGHMFRSAHQEHHAFRCFTSALYVYRHGNWDELHNHLRSALAAQLYTMGRMAVSLLLYSKLVGTVSGGKVSAKSQHKFINHLIEICGDHPKKALAGANRMMASVSTGQDAIRKPNLERIVQVIRFTKNASRVLELPYVNMPLIDNKTIRVSTASSSSGASSGLLRDAANRNPNDEFIASGRGERYLNCSIFPDEDSMWEQLQMLTISELNARDYHSQRSSVLNTSLEGNQGKTKSNLDESVSDALTKIADLSIRRVLIQLDKEQANRNLLGRARRQANAESSPVIRSRMEPIICSFVVKNLLAVDVEVSGLQLVACMTKKDGTFTNQDAILIGPGTDSDSCGRNEIVRGRQWSFPSAKSMVFFAPDFGRLSGAGDGGSEANGRRVWKAVAGLSGLEEDPCFVVTKSSIFLSANNEAVVSAGITPLQLGDLDLIGVRCRLFDKVWVYHPFSVKTRESSRVRANPVPSRSMLLKATVDSEMPCLTAELVQLPDGEVGQISPANKGHLLDGQISLWRIRLCNVGSAPATNVVLKTNFPWVCIANGAKLFAGTSKGNKCVEHQETLPVSNCVGPSGTLMTIPLRGDSLKEEGVIHPGEIVDVSVELRATGSGLHSFYMLYRYELHCQGAQSRRHRWLERSYTIQVYPSLFMSAKILPSSKEKEHVLAVELSNNRSEQQMCGNGDILLEKLSLVSRAYRLEPVPCQFEGSSKLSGGGEPWRLKSRERMTVHYRLIPIEDDNSVCLLSGCFFWDFTNSETSSVDCVSSPALDFVCLERAHERFEATRKAHHAELASLGSSKHDAIRHPRSIAQIRRANTNDFSRECSAPPENDLRYEKVFSHPTSIGMLCLPRSSGAEVSILCNWEASSGSGREAIQGLHHRCGISVTPKFEPESCPILASADYPEIFEHNFQEGPAVLPLTVKLKNQLTASSVGFILAVNASSTFELIGMGSRRISLGGGEECLLPMQALIPKPGVHDLQVLEVKIDDWNCPLFLLSDPQWIVTVVQS